MKYFQLLQFLFKTLEITCFRIWIMILLNQIQQPVTNLLTLPTQQRISWLLSACLCRECRVCWPHFHLVLPSLARVVHACLIAWLTIQSRVQHICLQKLMPHFHFDETFQMWYKFCSTSNELLLPYCVWRQDALAEQYIDRFDRVRERKHFRRSTKPVGRVYSANHKWWQIDHCIALKKHLGATCGKEAMVHRIIATGAEFLTHLKGFITKWGVVLRYHRSPEHICMRGRRTIWKCPKIRDELHYILHTRVVSHCGTMRRMIVYEWWGLYSNLRSALLALTATAIGLGGAGSHCEQTMHS